MKRFIAHACTGLLLALMGCGGGGGGGGTEPLAPQEIPPPAPPPPPTEAAFNCNSSDPVKGSDIAVSPGGFFTGTFVDCATGVHTQVQATINEDGVFLIKSYDEAYKIDLLLTGSLQTDGDSFQGSARWFTEPGVSSGLWIDGLIAQRKSVEGRWGNEWGGYGYFTLSADEYLVQTYEWMAPFPTHSVLKGRRYEMDPGAADPLVTWNIDAEGQISGSDETGCIYAGRGVQSDPRFNLSEVVFTVTDCALAGSYSGFASWAQGDWEPVWLVDAYDSEGTSLILGLGGYGEYLP